MQQVELTVMSIILIHQSWVPQVGMGVAGVDWVLRTASDIRSELSNIREHLQTDFWYALGHSNLYVGFWSPSP